MTTLVITLTGQDRPGLVSRLADIVTEHGGSWGSSQLAELADTFAGIVTADLPPERVDGFTTALDGLDVLHTTVRRLDGPVEEPEGEVFVLDLVGNDRPGIVQQISGVLAAQKVGVDVLETRVVPAPQAGGDLFEARAQLRAPGDVDVTDLQRALEELAGELQVDISFGDEGPVTHWG